MEFILKKAIYFAPHKKGERMKFLIIFLLSVSSLTFSLEANTDLDAALEDIVGRYGHYDIVAYKEKIGPITMKNLVVSYGLTDLVLNNGELYSIDRFCFSEYVTNMPFTTKVDDSFTQAIIPKAVKVKKTKLINGRLNIYRPRTPTTLGVHLEDLVNEKLPTKSNDKRLIDADKDGKPAVTVKIKAI